MRTLKQARSEFAVVRLSTPTVLIAAGVVLLLLAAAFWLQPAPESPTTAVQAERLSNTLFNADQRRQASQDGLGLAQLKGLQDKPEIQPLFMPPGTCRLVHDAEGNTEGHCDVHEINPSLSNAGQSPFGTGQWASQQVPLRQ